MVPMEHLEVVVQVVNRVHQEQVVFQELPVQAVLMVPQEQVV